MANLKHIEGNQMHNARNMFNIFLLDLNPHLVYLDDLLFLPLLLDLGHELGVLQPCHLHLSLLRLVNLDYNVTHKFLTTKRFDPDIYICNKLRYSPTKKVIYKASCIFK